MENGMGRVMRHIRNYFERERMEGTFTLENGALRPMPPAPYVALQGSAAYDGVYPRDALPEGTETFEGVVWGLYPPEDFTALCAEIEAFRTQNPEDGPLSERFGIYSCQRTAKNWQEVFSGRLAPYRRMFTEVDA